MPRTKKRLIESKLKLNYIIKTGVKLCQLVSFYGDKRSSIFSSSLAKYNE